MDFDIFVNNLKTLTSYDYTHCTLTIIMSLMQITQLHGRPHYRDGGLRGLLVGRCENLRLSVVDEHDDDEGIACSWCACKCAFVCLFSVSTVAVVQ